MSDTSLQELYDLYLGITDGMVGRYDAMQVAAVMSTIALSLYRTSMDDADYNAMVDNISASRDHVKPFKPTSLQ
jgi:hypothetical protein